MAELGKPREFSAHGMRSSRMALRPGKGVITAVVAATVLLAVLLVISGCVPTP